MDLNLIIPDPTPDGCYSKLLDANFELFVATTIERLAPARIHSSNAGEFLFSIWTVASNTCLLHPTQFTTLEGCNEFVRGHPDSVPLLASVHEKRAYSWLCEQLATTPLPHPFPNINTTPIIGGEPTSTATSTIQGDIGKYLGRLKPKIIAFLEKPRLPIWEPPETVDVATRKFYVDLAIPIVNKKPCLLLHGLLNSPNPNMGDLFRGQKHSIISNVSGAGKTRGVFEGLCGHWGFYLVVAQGADGIGARDLEVMLHRMSTSPGWEADIFGEHRDASEIGNANANNERIAFNRISKVLLSRWIVFEAFIQVARDLNQGQLPEDIRHDWLLFQVLPLVLIDDKDPFSALMESCLVGATLEQLQKLSGPLTATAVLGHAFDASVESFYYVLDEGQVAGNQYMGAFSDGVCRVRRPVLRPIIRHLTASPDPLVKIIVSGTGFSLDLFKTVLTSGVGKEQPDMHVEHRTGDFTEKGTQWSYIARYLPPSFLLSPSGKSLEVRVHEWLRGRHRFTARFLEELIRSSWRGGCPAAPHKLLNAYVTRLASFTPLDGEATFLAQEPDVGPINMDKFQWEKIEREPGLLQELSDSIYTYVTRGEFPIGLCYQEPLVEYGLAQFVDNNITVQEPLALVSIMRYFEDHHLTLDANIRAHLQLNKGFAFEEAVLLAITKLFQDPQNIQNALQFHGQAPEWTLHTAQIVTRMSSGQFREFDIISSQPVLPSTGVAFYAKNIKDVKHWITSGTTGWCVPGTLMGPDLMTWLRLSNGKMLLLVVQVKCHLTGNHNTITADSTAKAVRSLIPAKFFNSLIKPNMGRKAKRKIQRDITTMLEAVNGPDGSFTTGKYNILRVVAAFPLGADFTSRASSIQNALNEENHPLAVLNQSTLVSALATSPHGAAIVSILTTTLERMRSKDA